jgi:hypothetical protein
MRPRGLRQRGCRPGTAYRVRASPDTWHRMRFPARSAAGRALGPLPDVFRQLPAPLPEAHPATGHTRHLAARLHPPSNDMAAPATSRHGRGRRTLAYAAEHLFQRERHFLRQSRRSPVVRRRTVRRLGGHDTTALAALHLTEPTDHTHAATPCAMVEIARPVVGSLAARADQYLLVTPDPALPRAVPAVRIHLPRTTAIAGHRVPPSSLSPADVTGT